MLRAQDLLAVLHRRRTPRTRHHLGVAARAEGAARTGEEQAANSIVPIELVHDAVKGVLEPDRERIARLGPVESHHGDPLFDVAQQLVGACVDSSSSGRTHD
jgi:hypothetical protein